LIEGICSSANALILQRPTSFSVRCCSMTVSASAALEHFAFLAVTFTRKRQKLSSARRLAWLCDGRDHAIGTQVTSGDPAFGGRAQSRLIGLSRPLEKAQAESRT
jgi:hypothetical protein